MKIRRENDDADGVYVGVCVYTQGKEKQDKNIEKQSNDMRIFIICIGKTRREGMMMRQKSLFLFILFVYLWRTICTYCSCEYVYINGISRG